MKIAYLLDFFPAYSETFIVREILELNKWDIDVSVLARNDPRKHAYGEVVHKDSIKLMSNVYYSPFLNSQSNRLLFISYVLYLSLSSPFKAFKVFLYLLKSNFKEYPIVKEAVYFAVKAKRLKVEHIHVHFAFDSSSFAMFVSMLTGIPYSFTIHANDIFTLANFEALNDKIKRSKFVASISLYNKEFITKKEPKISAEKLKIIHCGLNLDHSPMQRKRLSQSLRIVSIGRLVEKKGFPYLIEACSLLKNNLHYKFKCIVIGEGGDRELLQHLIQKYDLKDMVILKGALDQEAVMEELQVADIFVLPCIVDKRGAMDGIPVALMEAMALGVPVISTAISGIPELVKHGCGKLVKQKDAMGLKNAMKELVALPESKRGSMIKRARMVVEKEFNINIEAKKLSELIKK